MKIIPWRCHICGMEFATPEGGRCTSCGLVTCRACLSYYFNPEKDKEHTGYICKKCQQPIDGRR